MTSHELDGFPLYLVEEGPAMYKIYKEIGLIITQNCLVLARLELQ